MSTVFYALRFQFDSPRHAEAFRQEMLQLKPALPGAPVLRWAGIIFPLTSGAIHALASGKLLCCSISGARSFTDLLATVKTNQVVCQVESVMVTFEDNGHHAPHFREFFHAPGTVLFKR